MATAAERLQIVIDAQDNASKELAALKKQISGVQKSVNGTTKEFDKGSKSIVSSLKSIAPYVATAFAISGIVQFGKEIFQIAVRLDQLDKKATTVLGEFKDDVEDVAKEVAISMGLTSSEFVSASANIADLLIPMGMTRAEASKMSTDLVGLSGALSEWSGGTRTATEVSNILAKAMLGEREQLKELGIAIGEADVKQRVLEMGMAHLTGTQLQQARATATQQLIFEKSTDAQAAFAEGGDSLIRTQNQMKASLNEVKEVVAASLTPAIQEVQAKVFDWLNATLSNEETQQNLISAVEGLGSALIATLSAVEKIINGMSRMMQKAKEAKAALDKLGAGQSAASGVGFGKLNIGGARAMGGPVTANTPYLVGEKGPEMFVPSSSGAIQPNGSLGGVNISMSGISINNGMDLNNFRSMVEEVVIGAVKDAAVY